MLSALKEGDPSPRDYSSFHEATASGARGESELRDDVGARASRRMPRGCSRHLSTRRAVSGPDLHRTTDRTCIPSRPRPADLTSLSPPRSGQAILNRIRLRRLIKGPTSRGHFSLPLCPSCATLDRRTRLPRSWRGNPSDGEEHDNAASRSPRLIPDPDGNILSFAAPSSTDAFFIVCDWTLMGLLCLSVLRSFFGDTWW